MIEIDGATGSTYTPTDDDAGNNIKVRVVFDDDAGHREYPRTSPEVGPVSTADDVPVAITSDPGDGRDLRDRRQDRGDRDVRLSGGGDRHAAAQARARRRRHQRRPVGGIRSGCGRARGPGQEHRADPRLATRSDLRDVQEWPRHSPPAPPATR